MREEGFLLFSSDDFLKLIRKKRNEEFVFKKKKVKTCNQSTVTSMKL